MRRPARDILVRLRALVPLAVVALSGCAVGPNYARPKVEQPAAFKSRPTTQTASAIPVEWWQLYDDPQLHRLVTMADESNQNLRQAVARVDQARALARVAASFIMPTVTADPALTRTRTSVNQPSFGSGKPLGKSSTFNTWQIPFDLSYEVDVWGRVRRSIESARAQAAASADDLAVVRLTVQTDVATDYYMLRALDAQEQVLQRTVTSFIEQVRIVSAQFKNGLVPPTDLYQAQSQLEATQAQLLDTQRARADEEHALALLCGRAAPEFSVPADPLLETAPPAVPAGLPGELLTRRPDVAEAEQNIVAFNAQVGVATAEFYPTFTLTAAAGFESVSLDHLLNWQSRVLSIGPSVSAPIFEGGRLRANLQAVEAQYRQAVAAYVNQVLTAYGDVEDALTDLRSLTDQVARMRAAVAASQSYLDAAQAQYKQGLVTYLIVIDAERTLLSNQLTLAQDRNLQMAASIHLIKSLGGGWGKDGVD
jgi:multidrug efflux system outer membrane protein